MRDQGDILRLSQGAQTLAYRKEARRIAVGMLIAFWVAAIAVIQVREFIDDEPFDFGLTALSMSIYTLVGVGFCIVIYGVLERLERLPVIVPAVTSLVLAFGTALVFWDVYNLIFHPLAGIDPAPTVKNLFSLVFWTHLFVAWGAISLGVLYSTRARAEERLRANTEGLTHRAKMLALRYQLNPHFLFNTLNSVAALILDEQDDAAERMITRLSAFLRRGLSESPLSEIPLRHELEHQMDYLAIEAERFSDRLKVEVQVDDALKEALVPGFILQPLVENAIKHGVSQTTKPVTLSIVAEELQDRLILTVSEDSEPCENSTATGTGVGLNNVKDRLRERYGSAAGFRSGRDETGLFKTTISLPLTRVPLRFDQAA